MIKHGVNPPKKQIRRTFPHVFGAVNVAAIPDFNYDKGLWMPDQDADFAPTECTGYSTADMIADMTGIIPSPDFSFAAGIWTEGVAPNTAGVEFPKTMQGAVLRGTVPIGAALLSAKNQGELYVADINHWQAALPYVKNKQNGVLNVLGNGSPSNSILSAMLTSGLSVSVATPWFPEFDNAPNGVVPELNIAGRDLGGLPWHNWNIKGKKTVNSQWRFPGKSWQGTKVGDSGLLHFSPSTIDTLFSIPGTAAAIFDKTALRFLYVAEMMLSDFSTINRFLPYLTS